MRRTVSASVLALALASAGAAGAASASPVPSVPAAVAATASAALAADSTDLLDRLNALPRVSAVEQPAPEGYRFFHISYTQDVDHRDPSKGTFTQRLTLLHKDTSRPMVMFTSGYYVSQAARRSEPTRIVDGNQLSMEYRFFNPSRPEHPRWTKELTIWQAATDQHEIIQTFKKLYAKPWITTGGSKGGMTATYHRRFYPRDVAGSVPYVAPNDVIDPVDVYNRFLDRVGGDDQACRDAITANQRRVLGPQRQWFLDKVKANAAAQGLTFDALGTADKAMEVAVVDAYFAFWQYHPQSECASVPTPEASNDEVYAWFEGVSSLTGYEDETIDYFLPYYFQASYQLGSPEPYETRLRGVLRYPGLDVAKTFVPKDVAPRRFDYLAMPDINAWVSTRSSQMIFVYGENDPWSAEPFRCGYTAAKRDCHRYYVPKGTHQSNIASLPEAQRDEATATILRWAGLSAADPAARTVERRGFPPANPAIDRPMVERSPIGLRLP